MAVKFYALHPSLSRRYAHVFFIHFWTDPREIEDFREYLTLSKSKKLAKYYDICKGYAISLLYGKG